MKKNYYLIKLTCLLAVLFATKIHGQCINTFAYATANITSTVPGTSVTVTTCNFGGDYNTITFNVTGTFIFNSSINTDYFTITDGSNNVLIAGAVPLSVTIPSVGTYFMHVNSSGPPTCGQQSSCRTTEIDVPLPLCAGTPTAGTVPGPFSICPNTSAVINASGATIASGITYQWQQASSASGPWTNVTTGSGFNTPTLTTASLTVLTYYQMVITCTVSSQSATTSVVSVNPNNPVALCYCTTGLGGGGCFGNNISNVSILSTPLNNNSGCSLNSFGDSYSQYAPAAATTATINAGGSYSMSVNTTANNNISFWIDYDHSGTFDPSEFYQLTTSSTANVATVLLFNVPGNALGGQTGLRVRSHDSFATVASTDACSNFYEGETEDYVITIVPAAACSGVPNPGTITATSTLVCSGTGVTMNLNGYTIASGLTFQWQSSPNSTGPWTAVPGATSTALSTTITSTIYYNVVVACGSNTAATASFQFSLQPATQCYCNQNLGGSGCTGDNITNVTILGTPLNNNSTCNSTPLNGTYTQFMPGPTTTATLNLALTYTISVNTTANNIESVWIDYDHSGTFDAIEHTQICITSTPNSATTMTFTVPASAQLGLTGMRVRSRAQGNPNGPTDACTGFGSGETEDYFVTIAPAAACSGAPGANSAVASMTTVCPSGSVSLSLATSYTVGGLTYQWFSATSAAGPYTAITGATTTPYALTGITNPLFYRAVITCTNGPASTTSTPVQVIVNSNTCQCSSYCASGATQALYDEILNVTIGTLNNSSNCTQTGGPTSILNQYSNYAGLLAAPTLSAGTTYNFSVTVGMCNATFANSGIVSIYMDFNNNGSFGDPGELTYTSPYTSYAVTGTTINGNIFIPTTALGGVTRMRVIEVESSIAQPDCGTYFAGETEDYCINVIAAPPCAGVPNPGTITATQTLVCSGTGVNMNITGFTAASGLTFQWYSSPNSTGPWTAVSGATATAYSTSITANVYYQVLVSCGSNTAVTAAQQFSLLPVTACYCNQNLGGSGCSGDNIDNVTIIGTPLNNNSGCNSTPLNGTYTQFMPSATTTATLTLGVTYTISVHTTANNIESVWIDYDHSGTFDPIEHTQICTTSIANSATTAQFTIPTSAQLGLTGMRVRSRATGNPNGPTDACTGFGSGETEDYFVTIAAGSPCSGNPAANSAVTSASQVCMSGSVALSFANSYTLSGLTYQWFSASSLSGPYTAVSGATTSILNATNITSATFYEAVVTCTNGPASTTVTPVQVTILGAPVYATVPFLENFDNTWQNRCDVHNVPVAANWDSNPTTGNQAWRRQDDGGSANWTAATIATVAPLAGAGCADFHSYYAPFASTGDLSLYVNLNLTSTYTLSFYHTNFDGDDSLEVFLSTDGGATFTKQGGYVSGDYSPIDVSWNKKTILLSSVASPTCVLKFTGNSDFGGSDLAIDSLQILSSCAVPNMSLVASQSVICNGSSANLIASGATTYTWSTSANTSSISVTPSTNTSYTVMGENTPGCPATKTIAITVNPVPAISVSVAPTATLCPGMSTTLTANSSAGNYTWSPGGQTTSAVSVTPAISTVYNVVTTNSLGCSTNSNVTVFVVVCTGLAKNTIIDKDTFIYPNPNNGNINVLIQDASGSYAFEINDLSGRLVYKTTLTTAESALSIKELANGMYTYRITSLTTKTAIKEGKLIKE